MKKIFMVCILLTGMSACKKFLDEKPDKKLVVPATLADLQALLDNSNMMISNDPYTDELSSDNFYLSTATWQALPDYDRGFYVWQKDNFILPNTNDWSHVYKKIYYANTVLENIQNIERTEQNKTEWDNVKGQALMIRGKGFLQAILLWSPVYDAATAGTDMGVPLRLNTNFEERTVRATVQESYEQTIADLEASVALLPNRGLGINRACRAAAFGYLARAYLSMRNYSMAGVYADSSLKINNALLNYNNLSTTTTYSMPAVTQNPEINLYVSCFNSAISNSNAKVDTLLYNSYVANDCRKNIFFRVNTDGSIAFKGSYTGGSGYLVGITTGEMFLTRAECLARAGNTAAALTDVNSLLKMRFKTGLFTPLTAANQTEALNIILSERRKELLFRGLRWMDIKRLNKEGAGIVQKRIINNQVYTLAPNDLRYALPIPEYVINISGIAQNPR